MFSENLNGKIAELVDGFVKALIAHVFQTPMAELSAGVVPLNPDAVGALKVWPSPRRVRTSPAVHQKNVQRALEMLTRLGKRGARAEEIRSVLRIPPRDMPKLLTSVLGCGATRTGKARGVTYRYDSVAQDKRAEKKVVTPVAKKPAKAAKQAKKIAKKAAKKVAKKPAKKLAKKATKKGKRS